MHIIYQLLLLIVLFNLSSCLYKKTSLIKKSTTNYVNKTINKIQPLFSTGKVYSNPDQPLRVANAKAANNARFLDIDSVYKPKLIKGKRILVTGSYSSILFVLVFNNELVIDTKNVIYLIRW